VGLEQQSGTSVPSLNGSQKRKGAAYSIMESKEVAANQPTGPGGIPPRHYLHRHTVRAPRPAKKKEIMRKCLTKDPRLRRGKQMIIDELKIKLKVALTECFLFQLGAKDLGPGTLERRIFTRLWLEATNLYRRMKLINN